MSGCTSHFIKDTELFSRLETTQKVSCANSTESAVEGRGIVDFYAENSRRALQKPDRKIALHVPLCLNYLNLT